jgi:hypothetical protein
MMQEMMDSMGWMMGGMGLFGLLVVILLLLAAARSSNTCAIEIDPAGACRSGP